MLSPKAVKSLVLTNKPSDIFEQQKGMDDEILKHFERGNV